MENTFVSDTHFKTKVIIFNTFKNPPHELLRRKYQKGIEESYFENGLICHKLFENNKLTSKHFFYYYSLDDFKNHLNLEINILKENGNSLVLEARKK